MLWKFYIIFTRARWKRTFNLIDTALYVKTLCRYSGSTNLTATMCTKCICPSNRFLLLLRLAVRYPLRKWYFLISFNSKCDTSCDYHNNNDDDNNIECYYTGRRWRLHVVSCSCIVIILFYADPLEESFNCLGTAKTAPPVEIKSLCYSYMRVCPPRIRPLYVNGSRRA